MSDQYGALQHQPVYEKEIKRLRVALADATDGLERVAYQQFMLNRTDHPFLQEYINRALATLEGRNHV